MATTKIWPVRDNLARVLDYAENHLKTANPDAYSPQEIKDLREVLEYAANDSKTARQYYVTGVNCIGEIAYEQMTATKQRFGKSGGNLAYHAYQSFLPDEVSPEKCHEIGVKLAKRVWGERYEVLVTTHLNTHCVHNHFVINSVSFVDGKKLNNNYAMYFKHLRAESDKICAEHGLSVIHNPERSGSRHLQKAEERGEPTMWNIIRTDIDDAIRQSMTDRQFYQKLRQWGYSVDFNPNRKYPTIRAPGMTQNLRFKTLGENYTPEAIVQRILKNYRAVYVPPYKPKVQHYRYKGNFIDMKHMDGLTALFLLFVLILRKIYMINRVPNHPQRLHYTPELREAIRRMQQYAEQARLLCRYKVDTPEQLRDFIDTKNMERKELEGQRTKVYNKMRSAKTPEQKEALTEQRNELSAEIKMIRRELFYAGSVEKQHEDIRRKIRVQREFESRRLEAEKTKTKNKERGFVR